MLDRPLWQLGERDPTFREIHAEPKNEHLHIRHSRLPESGIAPASEPASGLVKPKHGISSPLASR